LSAALRVSSAGEIRSAQGYQNHQSPVESAGAARTCSHRALSPGSWTSRRGWRGGTVATRGPAARLELGCQGVNGRIWSVTSGTADARASHLQCLNVRSHITAAVNFLDWLAGNGVMLSSCTQPDLDRWAAS
jgi:hypothetical protein